MEKIMNIELPVLYEEEDGQHIICSTGLSKELFGFIVVQEDSKEKAIEEFWGTVKITIEFLQERSDSLDRWKPLQIGPWRSVGGRWFTIFGLHLFFRYGKGMRGGWYIPFTKLNISFTNYWKSNTWIK